MRCIALLSGGKDSVAAVEIAQRRGWDVVACLRMMPQDDDAYMFHTPALEAVEGVAECLGIPLRTAAARPDPLQEVDDLEQALAHAHEDLRLDAILSGALASEYQRTRIDRIGHRTGLRTIAPLWHKDSEIYITDLLARGYDIRFSRVAADGLDAAWVGARLDGGRLDALRDGRMHIAGEGGEYETLVLDAPHYRRRLAIDSATVEEERDRATWHIDAWHTEAKP